MKIVLFKKPWFASLIILGTFLAYAIFQFSIEYEDPEEFYWQAKILFENRNPDAALAGVEKCLSLQADHGDAILLKGQILLFTK